LDIELGQCGHEVHACFGRGEGFGLSLKKVGYPCRQCKLKSGEGGRGILHDYAFGVCSKKMERMVAGPAKRFGRILNFSSFDESGTHVTLTQKIVTVRLGY
jgi:hypothetical protein